MKRFCIFIYICGALIAGIIIGNFFGVSRARVLASHEITVNEVADDLLDSNEIRETLFAAMACYTSDKIKDKESTARKCVNLAIDAAKNILERNKELKKWTLGQFLPKEIAVICSTYFENYSENYKVESKPSEIIGYEVTLRRNKTT
jgi:hypothetical protein